MIAGGVESMSRAPFVMPKATAAFTRDNAVFDTTIGWRFVNKVLEAQYGIDSMPETAENVAVDFNVSRRDQDAFALRSQEKTAAAQASGRLALEITPVTIPQRRGDDLVVSDDEHPRTTTLDKLGCSGLALPISMSSSSTKRSPPRGWPCCGNSASKTTPSTSTPMVAPSLSATRSVCRARAWSAPPPLNCNNGAPTARSAPCVSASARALRSRCRPQTEGMPA